MILVVDNHGFTTNILVHQLGAAHTVAAAELAALTLTDYSHIVIGHGTAPCDLSVLTAHPDLPVLSIGAGYQHLAAAYGHSGRATAQPVYGQPVTHRHTGTGLLTGVPNPAELISYHAWRLTQLEPVTFDIQARDDADAALIYRVHNTAHWGIHCDPAALQSSAAHKILENFLQLGDPVPRHTEYPARTPARPVASTKPTPQRLPVYTRSLPGKLNTAATFDALQHDATAAFWLDSAAAHLGQGNTSIMGTNTGELAQTVRWDVESNRLDVTTHAGTHQYTEDVLDYLARTAWQPTQVLDLPGFTGGWIGYLGYEAKQATLPGHRNVHRAATPDAYWIKPQAFLRYDHAAQTTLLVAYQDRGLLDELAAALNFTPETTPEISHNTTALDHWRLTTGQYQQRVREIQELLNDGRAAGICFTDTYESSHVADNGLELYRQLRAHNPAPYAGYLRFNTFDDDIQVLSASPETFLEVHRDGQVISKPIKGTVARSADPVQDLTVAEQMAQDPKIQSENLMITDLLRDDLAQVTTPGSVVVPKLMEVESFATVHQLVTTVTGQLRDDTAVTDALRAVFPGGSMTGAPKRFSIETLDAMEAGPRGIYSGTMGWLGDNRTAELNVIIRSIILARGRLSIGAGGAVVVDSDPVAEELEKHLKARALVELLEESS